MTDLADVADRLRDVRRDAGLTQAELAKRAGVSRTTVARMETLYYGDMSVMALIRLLDAAGYDLKVVPHGNQRTLDDIKTELRNAPMKLRF